MNQSEVTAESHLSDGLDSGVPNQPWIESLDEVPQSWFRRDPYGAVYWVGIKVKMGSVEMSKATVHEKGLAGS